MRLYTHFMDICTLTLNFHHVILNNTVYFFTHRKIRKKNYALHAVVAVQVNRKSKRPKLVQ